MNKAKLVSLIVNRLPTAYLVAVRLIRESKWFSFTPLPDGEYEFVAKNEPGLPEGEWNQFVGSDHVIDRK